MTFNIMQYLQIPGKYLIVRDDCLLNLHIMFTIMTGTTYLTDFILESSENWLIRNTSLRQ